MCSKTTCFLLRSPSLATILEGTPGCNSASGRNKKCCSKNEQCCFCCMPFVSDMPTGWCAVVLCMYWTQTRECMTGTWCYLCTATRWQQNEYLCFLCTCMKAASVLWWTVWQQQIEWGLLSFGFPGGKLLEFNRFVLFIRINSLQRVHFLKSNY